MERLARAGAANARPRPIADEALARRLGGRDLGAGVIERVTDIPLGTRWGRVAIDPHGGDALVELSGNPAVRPATTLFMDTETTGLAGGTGTVVFLLGLGRFIPDHLRIAQLLLVRFAGESSLLEHAKAWSAGSRTLVTYNGKSFDSPLLAARYRLHGGSSPFETMAHLDLLHAVRRAYAQSWPDCRLQTAESRLLAMRRSGDIPGSEVPQAWFRWLRRGESDGLAAVMAHNLRDLVSLAVLPGALASAYGAPLDHGASVSAGARLYLAGGDEPRALEHLKRHRRSLDHRGLRELARLSRRRGEWRLATSIWRELTASGDVGALEHLAKYNEHVTRDLDAALGLTRRLLAAEPLAPQHQRRERRLAGKLARSR